MDSQYSELLSLFLDEDVRYKIKRGFVTDILDRLLYKLKDLAEADYVTITVWDKAKDIPHLHRYVSVGGIYIPPARPGRSALGVCMSTGQPVYGSFCDFYGAAAELCDLIGEVLCIPLHLVDDSFTGAIGIGRIPESPPISSWVVNNIEIASDIVSVIVNFSIVADLLNKEERVLDALGLLLDALEHSKSDKSFYNYVTSLIGEFFRANYAVLCVVDRFKRMVIPVSHINISDARPIPFGKGVLGIVAEAGKPRFFREYPFDAVPEGYEQYAVNVKNAMVAPVEVDGKIEFVIGVSRSRRDVPFDSSDYYLFRIFIQVLEVVFSIFLIRKQRELWSRVMARSRRLETLGVLASGVAHDINNMINVIMGYSQLGLEVVRDKETFHYLETIYKQCLELAQISQQILSLSRESYNEKVYFDVRSVVVSVVEFLKGTAPSSVSIDYTVEGDDSFVVYGPPSGLRLAVLNLATNAIDAMPEGGRLSLSIYKGTFPVDGRKAVVIEVSDTGCGIPEDIGDKIFDPFFTTKGEKGTGLGLAQVHAAVNSMGGFVDFVSYPGVGTSFYIYLPDATHGEKQ